MFLSSVLWIVFVTGCSYGGTATSGTGDAIGGNVSVDINITPSVIPPKWSFWRPFFGNASVEDGYGMYTYVLFGRNIVDSDLSLEAERYKRLLAEIIASTPYDDAEDSDFHKNKKNIFYIPVKSDSVAYDEYMKERRLTTFLYRESEYEKERKRHLSKMRKSLPVIKLSEYSFYLAQKYLASISQKVIISRSVAIRFISRPGPFLVSVLMPLHRGHPLNTTILFADLSETHPDSIPEVVAAYKQRIHSRALSEEEHFEPFRLWLLNQALVASDNVGFIKRALEQWVN